MPILPNTGGLSVDTVLELESYPSTTYFLDTQSMQLRNQVDGLQAVAQAVEIALRVERFQWQIYSVNFGVEFDGLIGQDFGFVAAMLERRIKEALRVDDRIRQVGNFQFLSSDDGSVMTVTFDVTSVFGSFSTSLGVNV